MKYVLVIPDGVADQPQEVLDGLTPLEAARTPACDAVAASGIVGRTDNVPGSMPSGSDVGTMSLFGYDPLVYHTGRAPLEAAAQGIQLNPGDWALRCNLVTVIDGKMASFTADQVSSEAGAELIQLMQKDQCGDSHWKFHSGVSYRNLLLYRSRGVEAPFDSSTTTVPPHDLTDKAVQLPEGAGSEVLREMMGRSEELFRDSAPNQQRQSSGERPVTGIWLWGQGQAPQLQPFQERFGVTAAVITAVDLLRGIGQLLGWDIIEVEGATGYIDTDYAAKGRAAIEALDAYDFVVVHVEATDEASHEGECAAKVEAMERIDQDIVRPVHAALKERGDYRLLICPDHPTFLSTRTHSHGYCPFAMAGTGVDSDAATAYGETQAAKSSLVLDQGHELMSMLIGGPQGENRS